MFCLVRLLCFILLCVLVDSNQQSQAFASNQQQLCGCHGRDGRDGRDGLSGRDGVKGDKGDQGRDGKTGEPGMCDIKELIEIKSKLKALNQEMERLKKQLKPTPCDQDCKHGLHYFEKFQGIPTKGAAAVKSFSIGDELFLVFANYRGDKSKYKAESVIYKMENGRFVENQTLSTHGAFGIEHFIIDKVHYMAIANHYDISDGGYKQNSSIYKWKGGKFEEFQLISTNGASGVKFFSIEGEHYLAFSEYHDGSTTTIDSFLYKWRKGRFVKYQNFPTEGAMACDSIVIANETYLVYANYFHPQKKYIIDSNVYKWSGGHFLKTQTMQTQGAYSAKFFRFSGHVFLAFANYYTGSSHNITSPIYKWDGAKFTFFREIPTRGAIELCPFEMNGEMFLAVASHQGDKTGYSVRSVVYKVSGAQFAFYQDLQTFGGRGVDAFDYEGQSYLVFANYRKSKSNIDSFVYKFV